MINFIAIEMALWEMFRTTYEEFHKEQFERLFNSIRKILRDENNRIKYY